jgi:hypothetical protein
MLERGSTLNRFAPGEEPSCECARLFFFRKLQKDRVCLPQTFAYIYTNKSGPEKYIHTTIYIFSIKWRILRKSKGPVSKWAMPQPLSAIVPESLV